MINHLKYSSRCYKEHRRRHLFVDLQPAANSADVKRCNYRGALPYLYGQGPVQPIQEEAYRVLEDIDKVEQDTVEDFITLFEQLSEQTAVVEEAITAVHQAFYRSCAYAPRLITLFCLAVDHYIDSGLVNDEPHEKFLQDRTWCLGSG